MEATPDPSEGWIPEEEYARIQALVPILCVDLLPLGSDGDTVGLIRRSTPGGGEGWCLVGGAVKRGEELFEALRRHLSSTLGPDVDHKLASPAPLTIAEYFPERSEGRLHDPRKHAVALTYAGTIGGSPRPRGEAHDFRWFRRDELGAVEFGFGQGRVVEEVLRRL